MLYLCACAKFILVVAQYTHHTLKANNVYFVSHLPTTIHKKWKEKFHVCIKTLKKLIKKCQNKTKWKERGREKSIIQ